MLGLILLLPPELERAKEFNDMIPSCYGGACSSSPECSFVARMRISRSPELVEGM